jgi:eukaryotic-like serine/threonine-protein kinase
VLSSGHLLDNRYRLDERIATGGMGDVWRGTDIVLGRVIAVKVLRPAMLADPEFAARFYGEARMMAAFRHPGVVEVYDYAGAGEPTGSEDDCAYLVMAYVEGEPLSAKLKEEGRIGVAETMSIVAQTGEALHAAHQHGTVHRDVKPGNLIVKPNGTVILVDFGVARSNAVTSLTGLNAIVGTALYMAPEQVAKGNVTPATDIYALGAVAYHCIAGVPPFDGDNALQVALRHLEDEPEPLPAEVPEPVRALISRAMAKHPGDRFASAAEFAEAALATTGPTDWRAMTGTAMTGNAPTRPSMTGTAMTTPLSTAPPTRTVPIPGGPASAPPPRRRGTPRAQLAVQLIVVALFLVAIGLAVAIWLTNGNDSQTGTPGNQPTAGVTGTASPDDSPSPTSTTTVKNPVRPNEPPKSTGSKSPSASPSASPSVAPSSPAVTKPASPPTTQPPTPPTVAPTTPAAGGDGTAAGAGTEVDGPKSGA